MSDDLRKSETDTRRSLADPNYKGDDYMIDLGIEKGPLTNRRCTDLCCLAIFLVALGFGGYIFVYALEHGDPDSIMAPMDANGKFCGRDPGYEDYPYLFFADIEYSIWIPWAVCVKQCPMISDPTSPQFECVGTDNIESVDGECTIIGPPYDSSLFLDRWCLPVYDTLPATVKSNYDNVIGSIGLDDIQSYIRDIEKASMLYLVSIGTCLAVIFLYNWMLRCFAEILTWIAISLVGAGLFVLGWFVRDYGAVNYPEGDTTQKWLNIASGIIWALLGVYCLAVCCLYYSIKISVRVLKTASKIITRNMRMVIVPVIGVAVVTAWVAFSVYFLLWVMSCGEIEREEVPLIGVHYYTYVWTKEQKGYIWFSLFLFFWVSAFLMAMSQYVLIVAIVSWYFTENETTRGNFSICKGYWWAIRYNIGSILFGSFVLALVWMIRVIFEYIQRKIQGANGDRPLPRPIQWLLTCTRCCLDCCHRFIKYVNMNAYCQVALTGESFCMAAMNGFILILKNAGCFVITGGIGGLFNLIGKLFVCVVNMLIAWVILDMGDTSLVKDVNSPVGPLCIVFVLTYVIAQIFMGMYTTCATCLLHCLFADIDICNQLNYDQMVGRNRPKEMKSIVKTLSKPRQTSDSIINGSPEQEALAPKKN